MFSLESILRQNIKKVKAYSSARDEFNGEAKVFLDANENSLGSPLLKWYNRYPDPHQKKIKQALSAIKQVAVEQIFIGNGSDECIDLLIRCFCNPGVDNMIICPPTYGMYEVSAGINDVEIKKIPLLNTYQLDLDSIAHAIDALTKIIWLCSPNNPTGNSLNYHDIETLANNFDGIVVIDEAYINFAKQKSFLSSLIDYPNVVVLQTLSKAWGLAGLRLGMAFASRDIIEYLDKIKPPYNINQATQELVLQALEDVGQVNDMIREIVSMREELILVLKKIPCVQQVFASDANFLLVQVDNVLEIYNYLLKKEIVVRDRSNVILCAGCIRITIGSEKENTILVDALIDYVKDKISTQLK